ncbi:hypothetical protein EV184_10495 [Sinorhizobium americanum]|uniref:Uncharacterized protein n=1 Tax=Sinorhizobium americanum TaxID=194963 RepID=A0A4V2RFG1_9HYPH|nr:hypothetical protein EV184_10495 [Sinorhizobium americanum]
MSVGFEVHSWRLPLTLALSPRAGRGDERLAVLHLAKGRKDDGATASLLPALRGEGAGRRMRGDFFERDHRHG